MNGGAAGELLVVGLGPGPDQWRTPEVEDALSRATDLIGYKTYLDRCPQRDGQIRHASDNRVELDRAREAIALTRQGHTVAVVSGGDPGVFAMAAAVFEALDADATARDIIVTVMPGVSAMQAASARLGAPLGHDFCVISLSDNLKPWSLIERRLKAAAEGDFVIALYNPASKARPTQIIQAFDLLRTHKSGETPVAFARAIGRPGEAMLITTLAEADPSVADMATLVIIGSSQTRLVPRPGAAPWIYTPRSTPDRAG
ncbi:precorrin-3B C(17)-methyltransferase [Methyloferula stellata]|uniref:precorrin-3B C(17)-methyltransferase n=1 Tax=Methyloferula stellata TaxID=876270 RepID=UPI00036B50BE|nr:precorrin-3B C(17)-methyltransferase [Methyloferula stellata]